MSVPAAPRRSMRQRTPAVRFVPPAFDEDDEDAVVHVDPLDNAVTLISEIKDELESSADSFDEEFLDDEVEYYDEIGARSLDEDDIETETETETEEEFFDSDEEDEDFDEDE